MSTRRPMGTALGSTAWLRPASFDPSVVHLRLMDDTLTPSADDVAEWVEHVRQMDGVTMIRTSALFADAADRFVDAGFEVVDTLVLLRADLERRPRSATTTLAIRPNEFAAAARVDEVAFGRRWSHDPQELREIRFATPACRIRVRTRSAAGWQRGAVGLPVRARHVDAFAIAGAAREHGYLQRLAVDPAAQRCGNGRALTLDALNWMARRRLRDCLVNTSVNNEPALALYESTGFRRLREYLRVLEFHVAP